MAPGPDTDRIDRVLGELPNPDKRREGRDELLDLLLDEALEGTLGEDASWVNVTGEQLKREAMTDADQILAAADEPWAALVQRRTRQRDLSLKRQSEETSFAFAFREAALLSSSPAFLGAVLAVAIGALALLLGIYYVFIWEERSTLGLVLLGAGASALFVAPRIWRRFRGLGPIGVANEQAEAAAGRFLISLRQAGVFAWLRQRINRHREEGSSFSRVLHYGDASGLAEIDDSRCEISTGAKDRLLGLMQGEKMPGGAIGLSGPRGAGKSTLMASVCKSGDDVLGTVVHAPVEYDARDFVLHLFAKVCGEVVGPEQVAELRGRSRPSPLAPPLVESLLTLPMLGGMFLFLAGFALFLDAFYVKWGKVSLGAWGALVALAGYAIVVTYLIRERPRRRQAALARRLREAGTENAQTAISLLQQIWFQQSFTSGWSGSFKSPVGLEAGSTSSTELAERQMSFPEVVDLFRKFLEQVSATRQVRIGIDELDKMEDDAARRFLNEIKVVFRVPGCFFLISVSEDAMSAFERRGLSFRDVFDSTFDDVVPVPCLSLTGSEALLAKRIVGLPQPYVCLLHCLSSGLPRDLIRAARSLTELDKGIELDEAVATLIADATEKKVGATRVAARRARSEKLVSLLVEWIDDLEVAGVDPGALLRTCGNLRESLLTPLAAVAANAPALERDAAELRALGLQLATFAYLAATVVEVFGRFTDADSFAAAVAGEEMRDSLVDRLADVSPQFSLDLGSAWTELSQLRRGLGLKATNFPVRDTASLVPRLNGGLPGSAALASVPERLLGALR